MNHRNQSIDDVNKSYDIGEKEEMLFKLYMKTKHHIDLKKFKRFCSFYFKPSNNDLVYIEYKTIWLKGCFQYEDDKGDCIIYDFVVIGKDKIMKYINILEKKKDKSKNNFIILPTLPLILLKYKLVKKFIGG